MKLRVSFFVLAMLLASLVQAEGQKYLSEGRCPQAQDRVMQPGETLWEAAQDFYGPTGYGPCVLTDGRHVPRVPVTATEGVPSDKGTRYRPSEGWSRQGTKLVLPPGITPEMLRPNEFQGVWQFGCGNDRIFKRFVPKLRRVGAEPAAEDTSFMNDRMVENRSSEPLGLIVTTEPPSPSDIGVSGAKLRGTVKLNAVSEPRNVSCNFWVMASNPRDPIPVRDELRVKLGMQRVGQVDGIPVPFETSESFPYNSRVTYFAQCSLEDRFYDGGIQSFQLQRASWALRHPAAWNTGKWVVGTVATIYLGKVIYDAVTDDHPKQAAPKEPTCSNCLPPTYGFDPSRPWTGDPRSPGVQPPPASPTTPTNPPPNAPPTVNPPQPWPTTPAPPPTTTQPTPPPTSPTAPQPPPYNPPPSPPPTTNPPPSNPPSNPPAPPPCWGCAP